MIKVIVNGANGRMGSEAVNAIKADKQLELVATLGRQDNLAKTIQDTKADVVVDFTSPDAVYENTQTIINNHARPVIGTTGLSAAQISALKKLSQEHQLGGLIAPNFSIGAVLMMRFSELAAEYLPHVEIIELHHDKKKDAPSGTAIKTAEMIARKRKQQPSDATEKETLTGARGGDFEGIHIHSVRLPGLVAHQQVQFGGVGETLTIRHDSIHRESFMPGVVMACKKVMALHELVYGLEHLL